MVATALGSNVATLRLGRVADREMWAFLADSLVDDTTVSSLGCTNRVITVANLHELRNRINISSSQGPTRDARWSPILRAPEPAL
jgi:hypothetical protein